MLGSSPARRRLAVPGELGLEREGLELIEPAVQCAHPLDDGTAVALHRSLDDTADGLGPDGEAYAALIEPFARDWNRLAGFVLGPPLRPPRHPLLAARFGIAGLRSAQGLARTTFDGPRARALFAGMAAHSFMALTAPGTAAFALVLLTLGHAAGWPVAGGGSGSIADAMRVRLESLGGTVETGHEFARCAIWRPTPGRSFSTSHRARSSSICGEELPDRYRAALARYRYGPGYSSSIMRSQDLCPGAPRNVGEAGTVHLGGTFDEIAAGELAVARGSHADRPFVLLAQQSLLDPTRAPAGRHTLWAYCHVPGGSDVDMTGAIEAQIERFAPGFRDLVLERAARGPGQIEDENPNYVGGDINGGAASLRQILARPTARASPYTTPNPRLFICSSSTPPGGGVHGMCGYHAARAALRRALR